MLHVGHVGKMTYVTQFTYALDSGATCLQNPPTM